MFVPPVPSSLGFRMIKFDIGAGSESIKAASFIQLGSKIIGVIVQFLVTMVLARLLTPEQYGVVAVLTAFSSLFNMLADAGISTAVVQFQDLKREEHEKLFFFSLLLGLVLAGFYVLLSFGIAWFYEDGIYIPLGIVMTLSILFNSLNMVPNGLLQKERKFSLIGLRLIVCNVVVGALAIFLAFAGLGVFAIVLQTVLTSLFVLVWNLATSHLKMSFGDVRPVLQKVGRYSANLLGNNVIVWLSGNVDSLLAGKMFGAEALGYYNKAFQIYGYPNTILAVPITSTLIPFLTPLQDNLSALRSKFLGVVNKVSFICALCTVGTSVCSYEIIQIVFGDNWAPAAPLLQVLALAIYARGVNGAHAPLLLASNRSELLIRSTLINTCMTVAMICLGGFLGSAQTLAICLAIAYNLELFIPVYLCSRFCLSMGVWEYFKELVPDIVISVATLVICAIVPWGIGNVFLALLAKTGLLIGLMVLLRFLSGKLTAR